MKIFCDTNIIMEYLQQRSQCETVEKLLVYAFKEKHSLYISFGSFYTITYLVERYLKAESLSKEERMDKLRAILNGILNTFGFAYQTSYSIKTGINDLLFSDLEDSYQGHIAEDSNCDVLITINEKHFSSFTEKSSVEVLTPQQFIEKYV